MRDTILITAGTGPGGVGLDFERRLAEDGEWLTHLLHTSANSEQAEAREMIHNLAFDVDTTNVYTLNAPLTDAIPTWPIGHFVRCQMPGPDMVERIKAGLHPGRFEYLNGDAVRSLESTENASGGTRTNGWLAIETNIGLVEQEIRRCLEGILTRRRTLARSRDERVRCVLVAGTFGGFGSGSLDLLSRKVWEIAREMQIEIDFLRILLVPGTNPFKDPDNPFAITHGVMKELVAQSTQYHWHREKRGGFPAEMVKSVFIPTVLLSDTNHAPGDPKALSIEDFTGMASEFLRTYLLTDLGGRLDALMGDFVIPSQQLTVTGEPRFGRSLGIATIHLGRERIFRFSVADLTDRVLSNMLTPVDPDDIRRDVRAFFEARRLVQGGRMHQLSDRLLERGDGRNGLIDIDRFCRIYRNNVAGLKGIELMVEASARLQLSVQQSGDLDAALTRRREALLESVVADIETRTDQLSRNRQTGFAAAKQWIEEMNAVRENMVAEAAKDTTYFEAEVASYQRRVEHFQTVYIPQVRRKNFVYRGLKRRPVETNADEYSRCLMELQVARMRLAAHLCAIEVLNDLAKPLKQRLAEVQAAVDAIATERDRACAELTRVAEHRPNFECPVGLPIVDGLKDLEEFYTRVLPEGGEDQAIADVYTRLLAVEELLRTMGDPARLNAELARVIEATFRDRVQALHVADELRRRFSDPEELGAALRERDRESFEYLQLKDSCDQENGVYVVRLLGVDTERIEDLGDLLRRYSYPRGVPYQVVHIDDPDRIIFLQFRAVFPYSDWAHSARSRGLYDRTSEVIPFEKYHVVPGERGLPTHGEFLTECAARVIAFKAWALDRLEYEERTSLWRLVSADHTEMLPPLGKNLEVLRGVEGYCRSVDVVSHYSCMYLAHGPEPILKRFWHLLDIREEKVQPANAVEQHLSAIFDDEVRKQIEEELEWWRKNSVPAAMEWGASLKSNSSKAPIAAGAL